MLKAGGVYAVPTSISDVALDIVTVVNPDPWNALLLILVTELGMVIDVKLEQL